MVEVSLIFKSSFLKGWFTDPFEGHALKVPINLEKKMPKVGKVLRPNMTFINDTGFIVMRSIEEEKNFKKFLNRNR